MQAHKPAIDLKPITDALEALKLQITDALPPVPAITYKARYWVYDRADDEDGDRHDSVASYAAAYAFEPATEGGVSAYTHYRDDESYVTITMRDGSLPDNFLSWCVVHVRRRDDSGIDSYVCREDLTFCEAMHWAMHRETPAMHVQDYETVRGIPKVGECYWIHAEIERYPHFICPQNQYATVTQASAEVFHIRPATPVAWEEGDADTWGCVQFSVPNDGLEEFHACCERAEEHAKRLEAPAPLTAEEQKTLAHEALDAAVRVIQDRMGITTGDAAGQFFAGLEEDHATDEDRTYEDRIATIFSDYIDMERAMANLAEEGGK